jgi:hypothetical protein
MNLEFLPASVTNDLAFWMWAIEVQKRNTFIINFLILKIYSKFVVFQLSQGKVLKGAFAFGEDHILTSSLRINKKYAALQIGHV